MQSKGIRKEFKEVCACSARLIALLDAESFIGLISKKRESIENYRFPLLYFCTLLLEGIFTMSRTINDAITGAVVGNILGTDRWLIDRNEFPETLNDDIQNYMENSVTLSAMAQIIRSLKQYDEFWIDNISSKIKAIDGLHDNLHCHINPEDGAVLCWVYLAAFSDIFIDHETLDYTAGKLCRITHDHDDTVNLCIEYCHLIHDIFCNHIDQDGILEILPELDILAGDVPIYRDARSTFFAGLWAFVHATSYEQALNNCAELHHGQEGFTNWIPTVAGTLAGLYFGSESIPQYLMKDFKIDDYLNGLTF